MLDEPRQAAAVRAADLLVGGGGEDHVTLQRHAAAPEQQQHHQLLGHRSLHIHCAAPPYETVVHLAAEGRMGPMSRLDGHHVGVAVEQQRRGLARAPQPRHDVAARRRRFKDQRLEARLPQHARQVLGGEQLVAGWVGRVELNQRLQMADGFFSDGGPVHHR